MWANPPLCNFVVQLSIKENRNLWIAVSSVYFFKRFKNGFRPIAVSIWVSLEECSERWAVTDGEAVAGGTIAG